MLYVYIHNETVEIMLYNCPLPGLCVHNGKREPYTLLIWFVLWKMEFLPNLSSRYKAEIKLSH